MSRESNVTFEGIVKKAHSGGFYDVELGSGRVLKARVSGKVSWNKIKILPGDRVVVSASPYDVSLGLIVYRFPSHVGQ